MQTQGVIIIMTSEFEHLNYRADTYITNMFENISCMHLYLLLISQMFLGPSSFVILWKLKLER